MNRRHLTGAAAISATALLATSGIALGQDDGAQAHPLMIHAGTCDQLGDVVFPLGEISSDLMVHGEAISGDAMGGIDDQMVAVNVTLVAATLGDLTSGHALNIHQSEEDLATTIACGDIGGMVIEDNTLIIRLDEASDSGYVGMALFQEAEDGNTTVYTMLTEADAAVESPAMDEQMSPEGEQPSPEADGEADVTVDVTVDGEADVDVDVETPEPEE